MKIKNIGLLIVCYILLSLNIFAYINISPTTLDKNIGVGAYEEFTLYNNTSVPYRYKITPIAMEGQNIKDMSEWVEVYPKVVTVYPTEGQKFKVYIKAPKGTSEGDYGVFLNIRQMSAPKLEGDNQEDVAVGMVVMTNLNMGIYGYVGDKNPNISIVSEPKIYFNQDKQFLKMEIHNKTNRLVRMKIEAKVGNKEYYPIGETRAMTNQILILDNQISMIPKNKKAKEIIITDTETKKIIKTIKVNYMN